LDGLPAGIDQDLWLRLMPDYQDKFPGLEANYLPAEGSDVAKTAAAIDHLINS